MSTPEAAPERLDILHHFAGVTDPRDTRYLTDALGDLLAIAPGAMLSGATGFDGIAAFGRSKETWLRSPGLVLPGGLPSQDAFRDLFRHLDPAAFQDAFTCWVKAACTRLGLDNVPIDGKALRGTRGVEGTCLYLVRARAEANSLTLGQVAVEDKSNEITAIPKRLRMLELNGALATIDAMGRQKEIARAIRDKGADYLLAVQGNQPTLQADIDARFEAFFAADFEGFEHDVCACESAGHGRREERVCVVLYDLEAMSTRDEWADLKAIARVTRLRWVGGENRPGQSGGRTR